MIKNRNIALDAGISPSKIAGGIGFHDPRETRYVCGSSSDAYSFLRENVDNSMLFTTITTALAASDDFDRIIVYPGDYDEGAVLNITQQGLQLIGPGNQNQHQAMILGSAASHHLVTVNAHNVLIQGLGFTQTTDTYSAIISSTTASYHKLTVRDCRFDGYGAGEYGVHTGTTYDTPDIVVEDCRFHSWQTAAIYANATRGVYRRNLIHTVAAKIGIDYVPTTGNRPGSFIYENYILGVNSTDVGIAMVAPSAGTVHLSNNYVVGAATTIEQFANGQYSGTENYTSDASGGALIDIDS